MILELLHLCSSSVYVALKKMLTIMEGGVIVWKTFERV
jgi:hypothetical protein